MIRTLFAKGVLALGDRVRFDGTVRMVVGLSGPQVLLADGGGGVERVLLAELLAGKDFGVVGRPAPAPLPEGVQGVSEIVLARARWWERHLLEVLRGLGPDAPAGSVPREGYDPACHPLAHRERRKAEELAAAGHAVTARTVKHYRQRYQAAGLRGLLDGRASKRMPQFGRVDARVVEAMRAAIDESADASTHTIGFVCWRAQQILEQRHGAVPVPSQSTMYRLFGKLAEGTAATGTARARRSLAAAPPGPFSTLAASAPGEVMQIDSTPRDVLVRLGEEVCAAVELTAMVDVATRSITVAILRPSTKSADASVLLARSVTPEPMRPGWAEALSLSRSALPFRRLLELDDRLAQATARPVILPETIVVDHGKVFVSRNFQDSCRLLGVNLQPARKARPTDKPVIERTLGAVSTLFSQFVSGYSGAGVEHRGRRAQDEPLWSLPELQELLDEWIVAVWQNRPHDGLRDPASPDRSFSPNEKYAALIEAAGYVPLALSADDYVELLPALWRAVNAYGIRIGHRTYDAATLGPLRRRRSGHADHRGLWEVHHDPYDISRVWVRGPDGAWITAPWTQLRRMAAPFGELAWNHARATAAGGDEAEIARAAADLLARAHQGPQDPVRGRAPSRRERQIAARTGATAASTGPRPAPISDWAFEHAMS